MDNPRFESSPRAPAKWRPAPSPATLLLEGRPGKEGFLFHDGHNQPVHQAAPGLLGLMEGRNVLGRWKPQILRWLDDTEHFFNHVFAEFEDELAFEAMRPELQDVRALDAPLPIRNRFLFHHLTTVTRELERAAMAKERRRRAGERLRLAPAAAPSSFSLAGPWSVHYRQGRGEYVDREVNLPVNWELLPGFDNYAGTMRFTRVLSLDGDIRDRRLVLRFHGVDYFADVWVNGHYVGGHEGYFAPFDFDVSPFLGWGDDNIIRLAVTSPNDPSGSGTHVTSGWNDFAPASAFPNRKTLVKGTLGHHDARRGGAWSSITSQDGNTGGVWNAVEVRVVDPIHFTAPGPRLTTVATRPTSAPEELSATVRVALPLRNATRRPVEARLRLRVEPANFEGQSQEVSTALVVRSGEGDVAFDVELSAVRLWHPRDHGFPHLYRVITTVEVGDEIQDRSVVETGFRTLSVSPIGESEGTDGAFVVNGITAFVRGTNLLPTYWMSEYTPERIKRDFDMLTEAGFNAVLVHNLVLPRTFYEHANRNGFLVVQMFPLQWSYEQSAELAARATSQIKDMAALLANEPSVVSYEVHNEPDMRTAEDLDNRLMDFDLHAALRAADPCRWATTFSSGNHAYPGQFYALRDDNSFATLPGRFLEEAVHGRRISRHRNMPTEFGIQAMPHRELFSEILAEARVKKVLERIRNDPKWLASGAESWEAADKTIEEAKNVLGDGSWDRTLGGIDWALLWELGDLVEHIRRIEARGSNPDEASARELLSCRVALLILEVLHYGGFKGENFWFGLWRPAHTLEEFVASSQDRQYRLHKDAVETLLNAGVVGPIVGYFSFMFRDADWQAPTWGVVDAGWVPKKAYRAYVESNHAVRASLPHALRTPVKFPGDLWFGADAPDREHLREPWVAADVIAANDTSRSLPQARLAVWLEAADGARLPMAHRSGERREELTLTIDLPAQGGWSGPWPDADWVVPADVVPGSYYLMAQVASREGEPLSTNSYELLVLDTDFPQLSGLTKVDVKALLDGAPRSAGFHYWQGGAVVYRARPGLRGLVAGYGEAEARGVDLYETIQGEHLFRHVLHELAQSSHADGLQADVWRIRSEVLSPREKARALIRYLELFVERAEDRLAHEGRLHRPVDDGRATGIDADRVDSAGGSPEKFQRPAVTPVGRDVESHRSE